MSQAAAYVPFAGVEPEAPRQVPENWSARAEPHFERTWLSHLIMHAGQWCHGSDVWQPRDDWQTIVLRQKAWEVVDLARRLGFFIEADPLLGYRMMGCDDLPKYVHTKALAPVRASDPGQLTLAGRFAAESKESRDQVEAERAEKVLTARPAPLP